MAMNSVEGGESGRVGDKPDVIPVKNCKSPKTADNSN